MSRTFTEKNIDEFDYFVDVRSSTHQGTIIERFKRVICYKQYTLSNLYISVKAYVDEILPVEVAGQIMIPIRDRFIEYTNKYGDKDSVGLAELMSQVTTIFKERGIQ